MSAHAFGIHMLSAEELIDHNRRLLNQAEIARGLTRQVATMTAANRLMLDQTAWLWVDLQRIRVGLLADMVYLRHSLARARRA